MDWRMTGIHILRGGFVTLAGLAAAFAHAGEVTGDPGSPGATTTISGKQLPAPAPDFGGVIKNNALSSTPWILMSPGEQCEWNPPTRDIQTPYRDGQGPYIL